MTDVKLEEPKELQKVSEPIEEIAFPQVDAFKLVLVAPQQVIQYIDFILESVLASLPPDVRLDDISTMNVKGGILDGSLQVWAITGVMPEGGPPRPVGIGTTRISIDPYTNTKYLLVFSLYYYAVLRPSCYQDFWQVIYNYAKSQGCVRIDMFTENPVVLERAKAVGMNTSMHYCTKEVV